QPQRCKCAHGTHWTSTVAVPLWPPALAVIVTDPAETARTTPSGDTDATAGLSLDQVTGRKNSRNPFASRIWAASRSVSPATSVGVPGGTVTVATSCARTAWHVPLTAGPV